MTTLIATFYRVLGRDWSILFFMDIELRPIENEKKLDSFRAFKKSHERQINRAIENPFKVAFDHVSTVDIQNRCSSIFDRRLHNFRL